MGNRKELVSSLQELREDNIRKQKRGLHFIVASVFIWVAVLGIHMSSLPIMTKNLFTFFEGVKFSVSMGKILL